MNFTIDMTAKHSATATFKGPIAYFVYPRFAFMKEKIIYFYSKREANAFMKRLPKSWLKALNKK